MENVRQRLAIYKSCAYFKERKRDHSIRGRVSLERAEREATLLIKIQETEEVGRGSRVEKNSQEGKAQWGKRVCIYRLKFEEREPKGGGRKKKINGQGGGLNKKNTH